MSMKKKALMAASYVMVAALAIGGTVAYLTDRDNATNTFTMGDVDIELNEKFEQGAELLPGVNIEKVPTITNTGKSDAYVWMTFSIPSALDKFVQGTETGSNENVIHWNQAGSTLEGNDENGAPYVTETRVENAISAGILPVGTTAEQIIADNTTWNVFNSLGVGQNAYQETINGVEYNTYVLLYNAALESGETTLPSIYKVFLDAAVDIDPNGDMYKVVGGVATDLEWNINEDGAPKIYVNAYGIQAEGFDTVDDAFAAYVGQWDKDTTDNVPLNGVHEDVSAAATGSEVLAAVVKEKANVLLTGEKTTISEAGTINLNGGTLTASRTDASAAGSSALYITADTTLTGTGTVENKIDYAVTVDNGATVNIENGTYKGVCTSIYLVKGTLNISGGHFEVGDSEDGTTYLINCKDANYNDGSAKVNITGGTFVNFNPADNKAETGGNTNFVAKGYKVVEETQANGDVWYTVVAAE